MKKLIPIVLLICLFGCTNSNPQGRIPISGEVSLNGQPVKDGDIEFASVAGSTPMMITGAKIKDGKFETNAVNGLIPGQTYIVKIAATEEVAGEFDTTPNGDKVPKMQNVAPPKWGSESQETITCEKGKPAKFNFKL
ncbi:MAG: hypothetical protein LBT09_03785 [Planctomycetaceae bacterium]|jgi:hypothetical protein|nr:hypothetical protein [Planctomycetaceae bacterium]